MPQESKVVAAQLRRLISPVFFIAVVAVVFYLAATSLVEQGAASGTPIKNAALYPRLVASLLLILALLQLALTLRRESGAEPSTYAHTTSHTLVQILGAVTAFLIYLFLLPIVGYHVSTPLLVAVLLVLFRTRHPVQIVAFSLSLSMGCALLFEGVFNITIPRGIFGLAISF